MKKIVTPAKACLPKIRDVSATLGRLDPEVVAEKLGADRIEGDVPRSMGSIPLLEVRRELYRRLHSTGGRPGLAGTSRRKIPLSDSDWEILQRVASASATPDFSPSAGQIASVLLHLALESCHKDVAKILREVSGKEDSVERRADGEVRDNS